MNSSEAKKLNLPEILSKLGHTPTSIQKGGLEYWYKSPFRQEDEASFHTSFLGGKWIWNDFGDTGGTVIDFALRYKNTNSISEALKFLRSLNSSSIPNITKKLFSFQRPEETVTDSTGLELIATKPISKPIIISYLSDIRKINIDVAKQYLQEIVYRNTHTQKEYFAFGMKNQSQGYEIRAASDSYPFKSSLIKKDFSFIRGTESIPKILVFEGMLDFLSYLTLENLLSINEDAIIMHSLSSFDKVAEFIESKNYTVIHTYLDNDKSGTDSTIQFQEFFGNTCHNESPKYLPHKDINEFLTASN